MEAQWLLIVVVVVNRRYGTYGYTHCWTGIYINMRMLGYQWSWRHWWYKKTHPWYQNCITNEIMIFGEYLKVKRIFVYLSYYLGRCRSKPYWYYSDLLGYEGSCICLCKVEWYWKHKYSQISITTLHMVQNMVSFQIELAMWFKHVESLVYWWWPKYG